MIMSAAAESETEGMPMQCCASCGVAEIDDIKLKDCDGCDLVKYCSDACQEDDRLQHKEECEKRAAELHDELLFKQPESTHHGDCPICCLPIPIDPSKSTLYSCCCKRICKGCSHANQKRQLEGRLEPKCPFCRTAAAKTKGEINEFLMKRIEANDPVAMCSMGKEKYQEGDYKSAFEYATRAVALGDTEAHYQLGHVEAHYGLSILYQHGQGVEKDTKKELYHAEQAAIGGHPEARHNLGCIEEENGRVDMALKHWIIAAKLGFDKSLETVKNLYKAGFASKDDFTAALRGYQTVFVAAKSPQREEAAKFAKWEAEHNHLL